MKNSKITLLATSLLVTLAGFGCDSSAVLTNVTTSGTTTTTGGSGGTSGGSGSTTTTQTDIKRIVSTGPSLSFNSLSAGPNSLAINPITHLPAVAYVDRTVGAATAPTQGGLKYAWMDSAGTWNIETVDLNSGINVCGTAGVNCVGAPNVTAITNAPQFLRLAFKSDGRPAIAYAYGSTTAASKTVRFAERTNLVTSTTPPSWSISVPFTGNSLAATATLEYAIKAMTLTFDASDRPNVTFQFYGALAADGRLYHMFRNSLNAWTVTPIPTAVVPVQAVAGTTAGLGAAQTGAAICPTNGKLLVLAYNVTAAATSDLQLVQSSVPDANGLVTFPAGSAVAIDNGCVGAAPCIAAGATGLTSAVTWGGASASTNARFDLLLDSNNILTIAGLSVANPANKIVTATMATACGTLPSDFTAPPAVDFLGNALIAVTGETAPGLNGMKIASNGTELFMLYSSATATEVHIVRTQGGGNAGTWQTSSSIEGTLAALTAGEGMSLAYDVSTDMLFGSYAALPASASNAAGQDLKATYMLAADVPATANNLAYGVDVIDQTYTAFPVAAAATPSFSAAKAPNGQVGFALMYQDPTPTAVFADNKLYYGIKGGTAAAPVFAMNNVVNFLEGTSATAYPGLYPSLGYDTNSNPIIAYYSSIGAGMHMESLQVARSSNSGVSFQVSVVDDAHVSASTPGIGQYSSVATTGSTIGVSYYDGSATNLRLKFARYTPGTGWRKYIVEGTGGAGAGGCSGTLGNYGKYSKLVFTSAGKPVIAYQDSAGLVLRLAVGTPGASNAYTWACTTVDASANSRGNGIDMVLSSADILHLAHLDITANSVRYVTCASDVATCITNGAGFTAEHVAFVGTTTNIVEAVKPSIQLTSAGKRYISHYSALVEGLVLETKGATDTNWTADSLDADDSGASVVGTSGQYNVMLLNSSSLPMVFYRSFENWLKYFSREML